MTWCIGVGAGPAAGLVLAGPLFRRFNEIHYRYLPRVVTDDVTYARLLQPDHALQKSFLRPCGEVVLHDDMIIVTDYHRGPQYTS